MKKMLLKLGKPSFVLKFLVILLITLNLFFASWYVMHKDILFQTDIARDFLLLEELEQKKIILLGPRSSTAGLFHGPLWLYLNYPAFLIGNGNPLVVGWFWIILIATFLISGFFIAKKLFNETTAYLYTLLLSLLLVFEARGLFNPHGALFLIPAFFYFFIKYLEKFNFRNLAILLLLNGFIIQFQMAIGIPLLILSSLPIIILSIKKGRVKNLMAFLLLPLPLITFIFFEIRHNFVMLNSAISYIFGDNMDTDSYANYGSIIADRIKIMTQEGMGILINSNPIAMTALFIITGVLIYFQIKEQKHKYIYLWATYFYVGYYALTIVNKSGGMLYHYYMPLWGLTILIFTSLVTSKYKHLFIGTFILIYGLNSINLNIHIQTAQSFIGKHLNSWRSLNNMAHKIYNGNEKEFGYFLYAPDTLGYQQKYAMLYEKKKTNKNGFYFQKKPVTYLIIEPPPLNKPQYDGISWKNSEVRIKKSPISVIKLANGYKVEKYILNDEEIKVPWNPTIDTGIQFR